MGKKDGAIKAMQHRAVRKLAELIGPRSGVTRGRRRSVKCGETTICATRRCVKWKYGGDGTVDGYRPA